MKAEPLPPALEALVDALADQLVRDYLTEQTAPERQPRPERPKRAALLSSDRAA